MSRFNHSNFSIQGGQGFQITFENGYTVSVQFGQYHYCSNKNLKLNDDVQLSFIKTPILFINIKVMMFRVIKVLKKF